MKKQFAAGRTGLPEGTSRMEETQEVKPFFTVMDFVTINMPPGRIHPQRAADKANAKVEPLLERLRYLESGLKREVVGAQCSEAMAYQKRILDLEEENARLKAENAQLRAIPHACYAFCTVPDCVNLRLRALLTRVQSALKSGVGLEPIQGLEPFKFSEALKEIDAALGEK